MLNNQMYYRISNPSDVRDLGDQIAAWEAAGNPKANDWVKQAEAPNNDSIWQGGKWVTPQPFDPIAVASDYVICQGFDADRKVILLNKLLKVKDANLVASYPKLTALYGWMETVQGMAVAGQTDFPPAPFTFEDVLAEQA